MIGILRWLAGLFRPYHTIGTYDTQDEAIRAALDDLRDPGDELVVHEHHCRGARWCTCTPRRWTIPD